MSHTGSRPRLSRASRVIVSSFAAPSSPFRVPAQYVTDFYGLDRDKFHVVRPAGPRICDAIKIRILPTVGHCMGVHEIQIEFEP